MLSALKFSLMAILVGAFALSGCSRDETATDAVAENWSMLERYCVDCHNDGEFAGSLSLESRTPQQIHSDPEVWEKVAVKLRGTLMPPPGSPSPDYSTRAQFVASLESALDEAAAEGGVYPGRVSVHRLNRTEYARAIYDLFGFEIDARAMLPQDVASDGFDNIAEVLRVSPTHLNLYLGAARDISIRAVGNPAADPVRADYRTELKNHTAHVAGLPLGTRGGMVVEHYFPADGEYEFNINVAAEAGAELRAYPQGWLEFEHTVIMTIDGVRVFEARLGGEEDLRSVDQRLIAAVGEIKSRFQNIVLEVPAGTRTVAAAFIGRSHAESDHLLESLIPAEGEPSVPRLFGIEIIGPYNASGISGPVASRDRVFSCRPQTEAEARPCAEQIFARFARQAYRRPVTDEDLAQLLGFYDRGAAESGFETGVQKGLMAMLASTKFLYRTEPAPPEGVAPGQAYPISDIELAWRLSFFLWSQGPDEELLGLAEAGRLKEPAVLDAQVDRMLASDKSISLVTNFAAQWLGMRRIDQIDPDVRLYPNFDEDLRSALHTEMELFVDSIIREDRDVVELLTADHSFVNERLAQHYGIPDIRGDRFRRVRIEDPRRHGLLGKAGVLLVTSYPDRTSPVLRGAWILEHIIGSPPTSPPPGVETDLAQVEGDIPRSVRERLELHRTQTSCNMCHGVIDPLGQALENFDVIGEWRLRERDSGVAVDPTGEMAGGGPALFGPEDLRNALVADPEHFVHNVVEKLMIFALGRSVEYYDMPTVRQITHDAGEQGNRFAAIVKGIINSAPFSMRTAPAADDLEMVAVITQD